MPYNKKSDLPDSVKNALPAEAQEIWMKAFNSAEKQYEDEEKAFKVAWSAVKKSYEKRGDAWVKIKEDATETARRYYCLSFEDLDAQMKAEEYFLKVEELSLAFIEMINNIVNAGFENRSELIEKLAEEFIARLKELESRQAIRENEEDMVELTESAEITELTEGDASPLHAVVRIIKPGWGNKTNNHYYPKDVLRRDAHRFVGAKMYETDHRPHEKSTRTWVSTIEDIVGYQDGAPLAKIAVHDNGFAERLKNLNKLNMLEKMECSIYASGLAKGGFKLGDREGKQVEAITEVSSVDWVTRAGAGGAAVQLLENEESEMDEEVKTPEVEEEVTETVEEQVEELEPVEIIESEENELSVERIKEILAETKLPKHAQTRLAFTGRFLTEDDVLELAEAELAYLKEITQAGKPFGMAKGEKVVETNKLEEAERRKDEIAKKFMLGK